MGSGVADILLGLPNSITTGTPSDANERARNLYFYAQNDWNITSRLTLNAGIRYELTKPFYDANNRLANLVLDSGSPLYGQYVLAGDSRLPRALQETDKNNFAPRLGFAYSATPKTVVRGGFGISYIHQNRVGSADLLGINGPQVVIATINLALAVITEATLSFLGAGMPDTMSSLGTLIRIGNNYLFAGEWWIVAFPGFALAGLILSINLLGDWLRDALNPKLR